MNQNNGPGPAANVSGAKWVSVTVPVLNEGDKVPELVKSTYAQSYRPIEMLFVDGGSTDGTLDVLGGLAHELNDDDFKISVIDELRDSTVVSAANARNLGIRASRGEYIVQIDADTSFLDSSAVAAIVDGLQKSPAVQVKFFPFVDTWLEYHAAIDDHCFVDQAQPRTVAYRRDIFVTDPYDPELGYGDDADVLMRVKIPKTAPLTDARCGKHHVHSLGEWRVQAMWYGRTVIIRARKIRSERFLPLSMASGALLLLGAVVFAFLIPAISAILLVGWGLAVTSNFLRSPRKDRWRIIYLALRSSYASSWFLVGMLTSLVQRRGPKGRRVLGRGR